MTDLSRPFESTILFMIKRRKKIDKMKNTNCQRCGKPLDPGRRKWCSPNCGRSYYLKKRYHEDEEFRAKVNTRNSDWRRNNPEKVKEYSDMWWSNPANRFVFKERIKERYRSRKKDWDEQSDDEQIKNMWLFAKKILDEEEEK